MPVITRALPKASWAEGKVFVRDKSDHRPRGVVVAIFGVQGIPAA